MKTYRKSVQLTEFYLGKIRHQSSSKYLAKGLICFKRNDFLKGSADLVVVRNLDLVEKYLFQGFHNTRYGRT